MLKSRVTYDGLTVTFASHVALTAIEQALHELQAHDVKERRPAVEEQAIIGLKFSECLPHDLAVHVLESRLRDPVAVEHTLHQPRCFVVDSAR
jgi:ATP-dependent Lhr-like helicase